MDLVALAAMSSIPAPTFLFVDYLNLAHSDLPDYYVYYSLPCIMTASKRGLMIYWLPGGVSH